jgi:hypothetical protein
MLGGKRGSKMKREATKSKSLKQLQTIHNIGIVTAKRLYSIKIETPEQLKKSDPRELYERLKTKEGGKLDRCVLYQLRGAVLDIPWPECKSPHNG